MVDGHLAHGKSRKTKKSKETPSWFQAGLLGACGVLYFVRIKSENNERAVK